MADKKVTVTFIRCGMTKGSKEGRFMGTIDQELLPESADYLEYRREQGVYPSVSRVYSSVQKRCLESSYIIYPRLPIIATPTLRAFDYGDFNGYTYAEIARDEVFLQAAKGTNPLAYPNGEMPYAFQARVTAAFQQILAEIERTKIDQVAIISHKETILPILRRYCIPRNHYGEYPLDFGAGITVEYNSSTGVGKILNFL